MTYTVKRPDLTGTLPEGLRMDENVGTVGGTSTLSPFTPASVSPEEDPAAT
jgi:hypothetical protein